MVGVGCGWVFRLFIPCLFIVVGREFSYSTRGNSRCWISTCWNAVRQTTDKSTVYRAWTLAVTDTQIGNGIAAGRGPLRHRVLYSGITGVCVIRVSCTVCKKVQLCVIHMDAPAEPPSNAGPFTRCCYGSCCIYCYIFPHQTLLRTIPTYVRMQSTHGGIFILISDW